MEALAVIMLLGWAVISITGLFLFARWTREPASEADWADKFVRKLPVGRVRV